MTYPEFVDWCGTERTAHFLSDKVDWKRSTSEEMGDVVIRMLTMQKEDADGRCEIEYYGAGPRCDTLRDTVRHESFPLRLNRCTCGGRHIASFCRTSGRSSEEPE